MTGLPLVGSVFLVVVLVHFGVVLDLALDGTNGPDILVAIGTFQVATPLLLDGALVGGADSLHALDFVEFTTEVVALDILVEEHGTLLGHGDSGQGGD